MGGVYKTAKNTKGALSQNGKGADGGRNAGEQYAERKTTTTVDAANNEVCWNATSPYEKSVGAVGDSTTGGRKAQDGACEYSVAPMDTSKRSSKGDSCIACDIDGNAGRDDKDNNRQRNQEQRSHGFWTEGMDSHRQNEQHMGNSVPKGTQRAKRQTVSGRGVDLLRSGTSVLGRIGRAENKTKGRKREDGEGDGM